VVRQDRSFAKKQTSPAARLVLVRSRRLASFELATATGQESDSSRADRFAAPEHRGMLARKPGDGAAVSGRHSAAEPVKARSTSALVLRIACAICAAARGWH
jgi:hypothetical protein